MTLIIASLMACLLVVSFIAGIICGKEEVDNDTNSLPKFQDPAPAPERRTSNDIY